MNENARKMTPASLFQVLNLGEDAEVEFKSSQGGFPKSLWESFSAFANTEGGTIVLGVVEDGKQYRIEGLQSPQGLLQDFWNQHNNSAKISSPLCRESDLQVLAIETKLVLVIHVPRAMRTQRPVYLHGNPYHGSYKRNYEGDYRCTEAEVRQMLRDASDEPQDARILEGFGIDDLDLKTLNSYRNRFSARDSDHPFLGLGLEEFLERIGAWRVNRQSNQKGLTLAGLLMFGKERSLLDALPHYHIDYQEVLSTDPNIRWTYRLCPDGKWEPNLYQFYYKVYPRLVDGIDLPFQLDHDGTRFEETHVHEALREALVNTLVHADHQSSRPLLVIKKSDLFQFHNPGRLRIPREQIYHGGISDGRNPNLQKMFQFIGLGEKAGSGFQKILRAWQEQTWMRPLVSEIHSLEMTRIWLPLISMIPDHIESDLRSLIGKAYGDLQDLDRTILLLTHRYGEVANEDIQPFRDEHPREIGDHLGMLTSKGYLVKSGHGRGTLYRLANSSHLVSSSSHLASSSSHLELSSSQLVSSSSHLIEEIEIGAKIPKEVMGTHILEICDLNWITIQELSSKLNRNPNYLRNHYLNRMVREQVLEMRIPTKPTHPGQAYRRKQ